MPPDKIDNKRARNEIKEDRQPTIEIKKRGTCKEISPNLIHSNT